MQPTYFPGIFNVKDLAQAMRIILTSEGSYTSDERWKNKTPYVANLIGDALAITNETIILYHGCGIGRMARKLINRHNCRVVAVDISLNMRALAVVYVGSDRFCACPPSMLDHIINRGLRFDAAISVWVLQHCSRPGDDVARIRNSLTPDGRLFVLNNLHRAVAPVESNKFKWFNDGADIKSMLSREFELDKAGDLFSWLVASAASAPAAAFVNGQCLQGARQAGKLLYILSR
jgi:SAM-dependent methyltransferase